MATETSLASVFLGFGGQTLYTLGTACTAVGTIYGVNRLTSLGIAIFSNLSRWLGIMDQVQGQQQGQQQNDTTSILNRKELANHLTSYAKIMLIIVIGIGIKMLGHRMGLESTIQTFNQMLGYTVKTIKST